MKKLLLFMICSLACMAQAATDTLSCPSIARPGAVLACSMTLASGGVAAGNGFQVTPSIPTGAITATAAGTALAAGKTAQCNAAGLCILSALNQTLIADGVVATIAIPIPPGAGGNITIITSNTVTASLAGVAIPTTANPPVAVSVLGGCDINGDGVVNAADVALELNGVLAIPPAANDLNKDGKTDVVDVQIVINAASGKPCTAQ
jgi:Dockerin type I domain